MWDGKTFRGGVVKQFYGVEKIVCGVAKKYLRGRGSRNFCGVAKDNQRSCMATILITV